LRTLSVERMRLHIPSLFKCLTAYNQQLQSLHLNHIRLMDEPTSCPDVPVAVSFSSLQLSTLLPSTPEHVLEVLMLCKTSLSSLTLSFCSRLDAAGYRTIAENISLRSIEIHDKSSVLLLYEDGVQTLQNLITTFAGVRNVKIIEWPEWKSEIEKKLRPFERTVKYERLF
jgi:hypothetical protein